MSANNTFIKLPKKEMADESDTVPQTCYIKLEPSTSSGDFAGGEKSSSKPKVFSAQPLFQNASTKLPTKEMADESDPVHKTFQIKLESSTSSDDDAGEEMNSFKSEFVSAYSSVKNAAGFNFIYDEKVTVKKSNEEEEKITNQNDTDAMHSQISSLNDKFRCELCGAEFAQARSLLVHVLFHYGQDLQTLPPQDNIGERGSGITNDNSVDNPKADSHLCNLNTTANSYKCSVCPKDFSDENSLTVHQRIHTGDKPYHMYNVLCCKALKQSIKLKIDQSIHSGERPYKCTVCGESFNDSSSLKTHQHIHFKDKFFKCTDCSKGFNKASSLKIHQCIHSGDTPYKCTDCGKSFKYFSILRTHQRVHSGERPFKCTNCGKSFKQSSHLKEHQLIHSGDKPFMCTVCGKSFNTASNLKMHQRLHSEDKPFKCTDCGKAFNQSSHLKIHLCIHSGDRPYKCTICSKSFSNSSNLKIHQHIHSKERP